jgi:hypothetical protein
LLKTYTEGEETNEGLETNEGSLYFGKKYKEKLSE